MNQATLFDCEPAPKLRLHTPRDPKPIPDYDAPDLFEPDEPTADAPPCETTSPRYARVMELVRRFEDGVPLFGPLDRWTPTERRANPDFDDEDDDADLDGWVPWWCR